MGSGDMQQRINDTNQSKPPLGLMSTALLPDRRIDVEDIADLVLFCSPTSRRRSRRFTSRLMRAHSY